MYLLHYSVIAFWDSTKAFNFQSNGYTLTWFFTGFLLVVTVVALCFHMVIEAPFGSAWGFALRKITNLQKKKKSSPSPERKSISKVNPDAVPNMTAEL